MDLLQELRDETGMSLILITHDLGVVSETADRVAIMYAGRIVETGAIGDVLGNPAHPYTLGLLSSRPQTRKKGERLHPIYGSPPNLAYIPEGCAFHPRCQHAEARCRELPPTTLQVGLGHYVTCHCVRNIEISQRVQTHFYLSAEEPRVRCRSFESMNLSNTFLLGGDSSAGKRALCGRRRGKF
jgi:oligopeptide/dipeptide ABC transporter ATP-binding protein